MSRRYSIVFVSILCVFSAALKAQQPAAPGARDLFVTVSKSVLVDSPVNIERVSVANGELAEAVATTAREVLVSGKVPGETSLIIWQQGGNRLFFDLTVRANPSLIRRDEPVISPPAS